MPVAYITSYHFDIHVRLFPRILALRFAIEHLIFSLCPFCVKCESKQIDSLEITEHGICIHSCISCITCIHNRYSELGISCSDLVFSSESDLTYHCWVLRDQIEQLCGDLTEMKVQMGYFMVDMQASPYDQKLLRKEFNQMKTRMSLVMEILNAVLRKQNNHHP